MVAMTSILTLRKPGHFTRPVQRDSQNGSLSEPNAQRPKLLNFEDLPEWFQDNPSIRSAYRPISYSSWLSLKSLGYLHNESLNIYTHLVPAVASSIAQLFLQHMITKNFPEASLRDRFVFSINLFAITVTMALSTLYHTLINHSQYISCLWLRVDYIGILTLILGSFFSGVFVGFYCEPFLQRVYWTMIITLSIITSVLVMHPKLQGLEWRTHRAWAFIVTGLSGFAPIGHGLFKYGWNQMWVRSGMPFWFLEGIVYLIGTFFYASRFPESRWPGKYDIWGSSHQIFHVLVVIAAATHFSGVWSAYAWNYEHNRQCVLSQPTASP